MSNTLFKKVTASVAALSVVLSIVSPVTGVKAADASVEAANRLAALGVIVDSSSNPSAYNLGSSITRREMLKVMMNLSSVEVTDTCTGKFSDLPKTDWGCKYAEAALNAGFIAANPKFRPNDLVTEAEALKMIMQARGVAKKEGVSDWVEAYRQAAVEAGVLAEGTKVSSSTSAKRSFVFVSADSAVTSSTTDNNTSDDSDVNLDDLFGDLFDDNGTDATNSGSTSNEDDTTKDDTTDSNATFNGGDLEVSLSADTTASKSLPRSAEGVAVASYDLTAGDEDIKVSSVTLTRKGLGADDAVSQVALFADGVRVSKARTFNSSDDTAEVSLSPALVVKAGETVTLVAKVNTSAVTSTKKFSVELTSVSSTAEKIEGTPVEANEFEVQATSATVVTFSNDGSVTKPKLGTQQAEVLKFKVKNDTTSNETVTLNELTLKEDGSIDENTELANVALYYNGEKIADAVSNDTKFFTFKLKDGLTIKDGKTEKFVVKADIVGGANDDINFILDNSLDVDASASKYGYVNIEGSVGTTAVSVEAGEVSLSAIDPTATDIREDKDDIVLGTLKVTPKSSNIELSKVKFRINAVSTGTGVLSDVLENFELVDQTNGAKYDLTSATDSASGVYIYDTDLSILIKGETTFAVRADTKKDIANFNNYKFRLSLSLDTNNDGSVTTSDAGFVLKETGDDKLVTDITPSTLTWKTINGQESGASVSMIVMSDTTSVIGSKGIDLAQFQVSADDSSALTFKEAKVYLATTTGTSSTATTSAQVAAAYLYNGSTLLDQVSGSQLASGVATFDGFKQTIAKNGKVTYTVKVDLVDDQVQNGKKITATLNSIDVEDEDSDDVVATGVPATSQRDITISGVGTLAIAVDNTDSQTDKVKNVLGNTTSPFVASYELTATNEAIKVKDLVVTASGAGVADYVNAVSEVVLFKNDKTTEIDREPVTSNTTTFDNVNYVVEEGNSNLYVKVVTRKIGKDSAGKQTGNIVLAVKATDVEGNSSGKEVSTGNGVAAYTGDSLAFSVVPVRISAVSFVSSYGGETVKSSLTNGENVVGIIAVTTDSSTNTKANDGSSLKTLLSSMNVSVSTDATYGTGDTIKSVTVKKVNGTVSEQSVTMGSGSALPTVGTGFSLQSNGINLFNGVSLSTDAELNNGETVYYVVKATFAGLAQNSNKYFQLKLEGLDSGNVVYSSNDSGAANISSLRIGTTSISGPSISSSY